MDLILELNKMRNMMDKVQQQLAHILGEELKSKQKKEKEGELQRNIKNENPTARPTK